MFLFLDPFLSSFDGDLLREREREEDLAGAEIRFLFFILQYLTDSSESESELLICRLITESESLLRNRSCSRDQFLFFSEKKKNEILGSHGSSRHFDLFSYVM